MKIVPKKISELSEYENNPRLNDRAVEVVAKSIQEFGFKVPVVIDRDGVIVCGHTRVKAARVLGLEEVPCIVADDLTPEQVKAYRLADNKVAELATWDFRLLAEELDDLSESEEVTMSDFHFDEIRFEQPEAPARPEPGEGMVICPRCGHEQPEVQA